MLNAGSIPVHGYAVRAARLLRRMRPDLLYVEGEPYSLAAVQWATAARGARIPAVFYSAQNLHKRYPAPIRPGSAGIWRSTAGVVCVSKTVRRMLRCRGFEGPAWIVPLSVDESVFPAGISRPVAPRAARPA